MDKHFAEFLEKKTPKFNKYIVDGLATFYMEQEEAYLDSIFRNVNRSFPPGLEYIALERCTDEEEFNEVTRVRGNKRLFDLAFSSIYLVKLKFQFHGEPLPDRYLYLPFVEDGGIMRLGGTMYHITPVLSDKVISPCSDHVFIRLLRDRVTCRRLYHSVTFNGTRETHHVIWSQIYRKNTGQKIVPETTHASTCLVHYLLGKYGFDEMFKLYGTCIPVVGEEEINEETYPSDKWIICESAQYKPTTHIGEFYSPSKIRLAIPVEHWTPMMKHLVVGFYYTVDHFPDRFKTHNLNRIELWMILLGHIVSSGNYGEAKLYDRVLDHYCSLDDYIDPDVRKRLSETGIYIENFYDLLAHILENFDSYIVNNAHSSLSMYGKSLEVLYYVNYDITYSLFNVIFRLSKLASRRQLSKKDVIDVLNKTFTMGAVFGLTSGTVIAEAVSYSGDLKYPKITSRITEQEGQSASRGRRTRVVVDESKHFDMSMAEAGSAVLLSKANPTPTHHINPFATIDLKTATIVPNPELRETLAEAEAIYKNLVR